MPIQDTAKATLAIYWHHAKRYPRYVWGIAALSPVTILVHQFLPQLVIAVMLDKLSRQDFAPGDLWGGFGWLLILYTLLRMTSATYMWRWVMILLDRLEANVLKDIANRVFSHLLDQSQQFHADRFSGTLVSQTTKFMSGYVRLAEAMVIQILPLVFAFIFTIIILLPKAPHFVIALLVFSALYMTIAAKGTKTIRLKSGEDAEAQSQQTGQLADTLTNIIAVKSFAATKREKQRFLNVSETTRQKTLAYNKLHNSRQLSFSVLTSGIMSISVAFAIASAVWFDANIAIAFLVLDYSANIIAKLWQFSWSTLRDINRAFGESTDMVNILQQAPAIVDPKKPKKLRSVKGAIAFRHVEFTHPGTNDALFSDFNLAIKPGEKIGLVGKSGVGKTTLVKLLMRFSDISGGDITIDAQKINEITQENLRGVIAYVPQEPLLFHRSIKENISYGRSNATKKQIIKAAQQAHAHEFISSLPQGYDTLVGERGVKLSGGQRQRIAIARAILKDAPILILDEATSALDSHSEILIQKSLHTLIAGRTAIVIAHRLSTIQKMDRIIVMENGKIVEQGTHAELLAKKSAYERLWRHQSGGFIEE